MSNYLDIFDSVDCEKSELSEKRVLAAADETRIRAWLTHIGEHDVEIIEDVLSRCAADPECRDYYLRRASKVPPVRRMVGTTVYEVQVFSEGD